MNNASGALSPLIKFNSHDEQRIAYQLFIIISERPNRVQCIWVCLRAHSTGTKYTTCVIQHKAPIWLIISARWSMQNGASPVMHTSFSLLCSNRRCLRAPSMNGFLLITVPVYLCYMIFSLVNWLHNDQSTYAVQNDSKPCCFRFSNPVWKFDIVNDAIETCLREWRHATCVAVVLCGTAWLECVFAHKAHTWK